MRITLSANAGISLDFAGKRLWIDALHQRKVLGFSSITPELFAQLLHHEAFQSPDIICYTHCHPDHFSKNLTLQASEVWPNAKVISPESIAPGWILAEGDRWMSKCGELEITYIRLPHEGDAYVNTIHYGMILSDGNRNILIPGDCRIGSAELAEAVKGIHIDLALLDFPWIALPKGKAFLDAHIRPEKVCIYHLPFTDDDVNGYRNAAGQAVRRYGDVCLLMEPFQTVKY